MSKIKYKLKDSETYKEIDLSSNKDDIFDSFVEDLINPGVESIVEIDNEFKWLKDKLDEVIFKTNDINSQYLELEGILKKEEVIS